MDEIMSFALESGIWATLFCFLFLYMLKDSRSREKKYNETIDSLCSHLNSLTTVMEMCKDIKSDCEENLKAATELKAGEEHLQDGVEHIMALMERS